MKSDQDREGTNEGGCLGQPETGLPGPGGHIPTSMSVPARFQECQSRLHVPISSLRSYLQKSQVHSYQLFQNTWMDETEETTTQEVHVQQHLYMGPGPERCQVPKSTAPTPHPWHTTHGQQPQGCPDLGGSLQDNPCSSVVTEHLPTGSPEIWDERERSGATPGPLHRGINGQDLRS